MEILNDAKAILDEAKNNVAKGEAFDKLVLKLKNIKSSGSVGSQNNQFLWITFFDKLQLHHIVFLAL